MSGIKAMYRCTDCGHEQSVTEVHTEDGRIYAGSGANWCDECGDGKPERVEPFKPRTVCKHCYDIGYDASGFACTCTTEAK
jgi:formylmethanofuran dehydrogenase subunit E